MIIAALAVLLALTLYHDWKENKIPNRYTVAGIAAGLLYHGSLGGWSGLLNAALGLVTGFGIMLVLYVFKAVGAGDVKLFGAIGAMTGGAFVLNGAINSILFAAVIGLAMIAYRRELAARLGNTFALLFNLLLQRDTAGLVAYRSQAATFPFMYAVLPGIAFTFTYCYPAL
ncbi:A24 family peptidase [Paenibacillus ginsengarvi]|uniref:A24 family peptidase n=1 Tax=Paenibacillus ginsengarvi TaxID=400777 RepID=UPI0013159BB0|nr:A24 family peptidase [Paenibacillus ginsengarvi]